MLKIKEIGEGRNYFFGVLDGDWVRIIMDMFNGKLNKLYIENYFYTGYLPNGSIDLLEEVGSRVFFLKKYIFSDSHS